MWKKHLFCNTVLSMGCRCSAYIARRFSNAINFILFKIYVLNYILDDLASAERAENAQFAFLTLRKAFSQCVIEEAVIRHVHPLEKCHL